MDKIDYEILKELLIDCKQPVKQIAEKVNLSLSPVHERIRKMEKNGIIENYSVIVKLSELNFKLMVFMQIKLKQHQENLFEELEKEIKCFGEVLDGYFIAGDFDVILKVILKDMADYNDFILKRISKLTMIDNIKSSFVIKNILDEKNTNDILRPINLGVLINQNSKDY
ncbi:Lrp/AsnC family transcriptional regulator [Flavobacterium sp. T12S277]|uniref:Lrp/AsnC family transcriptional regulator n=1 Tax=Flavobacterium sp. T12S277 TaxID=3402752 RepID=UPI003AE89D6A